jgi:hypothetical protein
MDDDNNFYAQYIHNSNVFYARQACLRALRCPAWEVRNAATLAFAALVARVLGFKNEGGGGGGSGLGAGGRGGPSGAFQPELGSLADRKAMSGGLVGPREDVSVHYGRPCVIRCLGLLVWQPRGLKSPYWRVRRALSVLQVSSAMF